MSENQSDCFISMPEHATVPVRTTKFAEVETGLNVALSYVENPHFAARMPQRLVQSNCLDDLKNAPALFHVQPWNVLNETPLNRHSCLDFSSGTSLPSICECKQWHGLNHKNNGFMALMFGHNFMIPFF